MGAINIKIDQEEIKKAILETVKTMYVPVDIGSSKEELETIKTDEVMRLLNISNTAFNYLIDAGILRPLKIGHGFKFPLWQIKEFQSKYQGYDLSNYEACVKARIEVERKQKVPAATGTK